MLETSPVENKVLQFPSNSVLTQDLRRRLEDGAKKFSDTPKEAVNELEQILCTYLVINFKAAASRIVSWITRQLA